MLRIYGLLVVDPRNAHDNFFYSYIINILLLLLLLLLFSIYIYIYKTVASEAPIIFHVSTIFKIILFI